MNSVTIGQVRNDAIHLHRRRRLAHGLALIILIRGVQAPFVFEHRTVLDDARVICTDIDGSLKDVFVPAIQEVTVKAIAYRARNSKKERHFKRSKDVPVGSPLESTKLPPLSFLLNGSTEYQTS